MISFCLTISARSDNLTDWTVALENEMRRCCSSYHHTQLFDLKRHLHLCCVALQSQTDMYSQLLTIGAGGGSLHAPLANSSASAFSPSGHGRLHVQTGAMSPSASASS